MSTAVIAMLCPTGSHHLCPGLHPRTPVAPLRRWRCPCPCHVRTTDA